LQLDLGTASGRKRRDCLPANTIATGATLAAFILTFGPIFGAHFNLAVSIADASQGGLPGRDAPFYIATQLAGAVAGVFTAHLMFGGPVIPALITFVLARRSCSASLWRSSDCSQ